MLLDYGSATLCCKICERGRRGVRNIIILPSGNHGSSNALSLFFVRLPTYRASAASMAAVFGFKCGRGRRYRPPLAVSVWIPSYITMEILRFQRCYWCLGIQWLSTFLMWDAQSSLLVRSTDDFRCKVFLDVRSNFEGFQSCPTILG